MQINTAHMSMFQMSRYVVVAEARCYLQVVGQLSRGSWLQDCAGQGVGRLDVACMVIAWRTGQAICSLVRSV